MKRLYLIDIKTKAQRLLNCRRPEDLKRIAINPTELALLAVRPPYYEFKVRKKSGGFREIEAPELPLKAVQSQLNEYLQCVYFLHQSKSAYGYIIRVKDVHPYKNILSNAKQHLDAQYLLNADFKSFFHQITSKRVAQLLQESPFSFHPKMARLLTQIATRKGRLPMGAPTSPALSNLATITLDNALEEWSADREITYTRFVDDLTFSSKDAPITPQQFDEISALVESFGFHFNPNKIKFYGPEDTKKVTGLLINDTIDIDPPFYRELNKNIKRLQRLSEVNLMLHNAQQAKLLQSFTQEVDGMINFIGMIEGYQSPEFQKYRKRRNRALAPDAEVLSVRWSNSNYF